MKIRFRLFQWLLVATCICLSFLSSKAQYTDFYTGEPCYCTARDLVELIRMQVPDGWRWPTVDTFKIGNPYIQVTGIATTFTATLDVLQEAKSQGINFIITHEPTFYNHFDSINHLKGDPVLENKRRFIEENNMVVFRFHDLWHSVTPDGINVGMRPKFNWLGDPISQNELVWWLSEDTSLKSLARQVADRFHSYAIRVVGNPYLLVRSVGFVAGAPGGMPQMKMLQRGDVDVLIAGESREWETVEYVRDAVIAGRNKALILIGHANSEEGGMAYCADWLQEFITEVPITFIEAGDPFWNP